MWPCRSAGVELPGQPADYHGVRAELPEHQRERLPEPDDPEGAYAALYAYADLDALFELHGHIRAANPASLVTVCTSSELRRGPFLRAPNPFNQKRTVTLCNGLFGQGVLGAVRALTDERFRDRNANYLAERFAGSMRTASSCESRSSMAPFSLPTGPGLMCAGTSGRRPARERSAACGQA